MNSRAILLGVADALKEERSKIKVLIDAEAGKTEEQLSTMLSLVSEAQVAVGAATVELKAAYEAGDAQVEAGLADVIADVSQELQERSQTLQALIDEVGCLKDGQAEVISETELRNVEAKELVEAAKLDVEGKFDAVRERFDETDSRLTAEEESAEKISKEISDIRDDIALLEQKQADQYSAFITIEIASQAAAKTLADIEQASDQVFETLADRVTTGEDLGATLSDGVSALTNSLDELFSTVSHQSDVVATAKVLQDELREKVEQVSSDIGRTRDEISGFQGSIGDVWDGELAAIREESSALAAADESLREHLDQVTEQLAVFDGEVRKKLTDEIKDIVDRFENVDKDVEQIRGAQKDGAKELAERVHRTADALDNKTADLQARADDASEKHAMAETQISELRGIIKEALERAESFVGDTKAAQESQDETVRELGFRVDAAEDASGSLADQVAGVGERLTTAFAEATERRERDQEALKAYIRGVKGEITEGLQEKLEEHSELFHEAHVYAVGEVYARHTMVSHHGALFVARQKTNVEPAASGDDWLLVVDALHELELVPRGRRLTAIARFVGGKTSEASIEIPVPRFLKTWEKGGEYEFYDSVVNDGHRWIAVVDNPKGQPSKSKDWELFGMRGPGGVRGPKGEKGDPGKDGVAPTVKQVLEELDQSLEQDGGVPLRTFRGAWRYGMQLRRGDVTTFQGGTYVAFEDHITETPPNAVNAPDGAMFGVIQAASGGAGGGA